MKLTEAGLIKRLWGGKNYYRMVLLDNDAHKTCVICVMINLIHILIKIMVPCVRH